MYFRYLYYMTVSCVTDVSEKHIASTSKIEVSKA